jgi:hypothetical protein
MLRAGSVRGSGLGQTRRTTDCATARSGHSSCRSKGRCVWRQYERRMRSTFKSLPVSAYADIIQCVIAFLCPGRLSEKAWPAKKTGEPGRRPPPTVVK